MEKTTQPIAAAIKKYNQLKSRLLTNLRPDFIFYSGAVELVERIRGYGLSMCRPRILPPAARRTEITDCYNLNLALHFSRDEQALPDRIVSNKVQLGPEAGIVILTGPNRGGKTTYMQAIGLATFVVAVIGWGVASLFF